MSAINNGSTKTLRCDQRQCVEAADVEPHETFREARARLSASGWRAMDNPTGMSPRVLDMCPRHP